MCEPITIGLALTAASAAVAAGGQVYAASAATNQANYQAQVATLNRNEADRAAADALARGRIAERNEYRRQSQLQGAQMAASAANGLEVNFGTTGLNLADASVLGAEDAYTIRENAIRESRGYSINAANYDAEAKAKKVEAKAAGVAGAFKVAGTILGAASQMTGGGAGGGFGGGRAYTPSAVPSFSPSNIRGFG